jgi:hypothetical protein
MDANHPLPVLQNSACTPNDSNHIVNNVLNYVNKCTSKVSIIVFPECGSGYHEWNVLIALIRTGYTINTAIFMDSHIEPHSVDEWLRLSQVHHVATKVVDSYVALEHWTKEQTSPNKVFVIYINGGLKFGESYCAKHGSSACLTAAAQFWKWCDQNAANQLTINFIGRDMRHPADCKSWTELANTFTKL